MCRVSITGSLSRQGMDACLQGNHDKALALLNEALQSVRAFKACKPKAAAVQESRILNNIGLVHQLAGNRETARIRFDQALALLAEQGHTDTPLSQVVAANRAKLDGLRQLQAGKAA